MFHSRKRNTLNEGVLFWFVFSYRLLGEKVDPLYYSTTGHRLWVLKCLILGSLVKDRKRLVLSPLLPQHLASSHSTLPSPGSCFMWAFWKCRTEREETRNSGRNEIDHDMTTLILYIHFLKFFRSPCLPIYFENKESPKILLGICSFSKREVETSD